jgi:hypothetical protein
MVSGYQARLLTREGGREHEPYPQAREDIEKKAADRLELFQTYSDVMAMHLIVPDFSC